MRNRTTLILTIASEPRILPLRTRLALLSIYRASLHPQTSRENELTDSSAETAQEGVEWLYRFIHRVSHRFNQTYNIRRSKLVSKASL